MTENKEELTEQLKQIQDKKQKAVTAQSYEMASALRDREKEILKKLDDLNENEEKHSR
jgi:predicted site-specific integrase-resolvase